MLKRMIFLAAVAVFWVGQAQANPITMTFEGLRDLESINDFYNGGTGSLGSGPGPNYGVSYTPDSLAVISRDLGGSGNFSAALTPSPGTIAFFLSGAGDTMNVAGGFDTGFSFFYTSPFFTGSVTVWDGLNGTGTLLATLNLAISAPNPGAVLPYDAWAPAGVAFAGTAHSAIFSGVANQIGFDNITLGSSTPQGPNVPEPASLTLLGLGAMRLAGYGWRKRRQTA
jgi:hypothetical protein